PTPPPEPSPLSLHDALPILPLLHRLEQRALGAGRGAVHLVRQQHVREDGAALEAESLGSPLVDRAAEDVGRQEVRRELHALEGEDRKSTRLNSSHVKISYAV